ncbi:alpha/beta fold hydrolase [Mesobacillus harenae]|uniref:alpha/beta fold hydrolase n=1 Tax=Mesobacillus harenae TaxID=2213203 RepID=UPI00157FC43E|nr:alpha/beta hydrolase [Mesobacillus harenae]
MLDATLQEQKNINGIQVYYEYFPHSTSSETLVLLHGFLSSSFSFRHLIPLLKEDFNIVSVDLPPFGKSGKSAAYQYSYQNHSATVVALLKDLGVDSFHLVGHSMGGQISLNICYYHPENVKKTVLLCSSGYLKRASKPLVISSYIPYFYLYVKYWLAKSGVKKNLQNVVYNQSMINDEMLNGYMAPFLDDEIFKGLTSMIRHREGDLSPEALTTITVPCLLIWGEHDRVVPLKTGHRLQKDLQNAELIVLKDTGHLVPEEKPEKVHAYIKEFISE